MRSPLEHGAESVETCSWRSAKLERSTFLRSRISLHLSYRTIRSTWSRWTCSGNECENECVTNSAAHPVVSGLCRAKFLMMVGVSEKTLGLLQIGTYV
jgi:hypothetical protein